MADNKNKPDSETDRLDTEERILEAALQVFSMKGKDGARMREIAEVAGINKALLHYYFRSKDGLYDRVFEFVIVKLTRSFGTRLQEARDFDTLLRTFIFSYIDFVGSNLAAMRLMVAEHLAGGKRASERIEAMMQSPEAPPRLLVDRMQAAAARGEIRAVDPYQMLVTIISSCVFFFLIFPTIEILVPTARRSRKDFIDERKEHVANLITAALRPGSRSEPSTQRSVQQ